MSAGGAVRRTGRWVAAALLLAGAAAARAASLSVEDGPVVLGRTETATVLFQVDERPGTEDRPLRLTVNVGRFTEPARTGPGRYRAVYTPPPTRFPQVALVAAWRETDPDAPVDFLRLPLLGLTRVPVSARPGARVRIKVANETFGPVTANARGRAEVQVLVPPGVTRCEVTVKEPRRPEVTRQVPVEVPPYNRLTAALVPHAIPADGRAAARLEVFYDVGAVEISPDRIRVTPDAGTATLRDAARGRFTFHVVPPAGTPATSLSYAVAVSGDPTARSAAQLELSSPAPARVLVTPPARALRAGSGASAAIDVLVLDAGGAALPGLEVTATANGDPLPPAAALGDGRYELRLAAPLTVPQSGALAIEVVAHHPASFAFGAVRVPVEPAPPPSLPPLPPPPAQPAAVPVAGVAPAGRPPERGRMAGDPACPAPDADGPRRAMSGSAAFDGGFPPGPRHGPGRLLAGLTAGYTRSPGVASGLRGGGELWVPFELGGLRLGAGVTAGLGSASRTVGDVSGTLRSTTSATFVPVALKLGVERWATRRLFLAAGAGPLAAWARFQSSLARGAEQGFAVGWTCFLDASWTVGPGAVVLGLSYGSVSVTTTDYRIDPGGLSAAAGYRMRVF